MHGAVDTRANLPQENLLRRSSAAWESLQFFAVARLECETPTFDLYLHTCRSCSWCAVVDIGLDLGLDIASAFAFAFTRAFTFACACACTLDDRHSPAFCDVCMGSKLLLMTERCHGVTVNVAIAPAASICRHKSNIMVQYCPLVYASDTLSLFVFCRPRID